MTLPSPSVLRETRGVPVTRVACTSGSERVMKLLPTSAPCVAVVDVGAVTEREGGGGLCVRPGVLGAPGVRAVLDRASRVLHGEAARGADGLEAFRIVLSGVPEVRADPSLSTWGEAAAP